MTNKTDEKSKSQLCDKPFAVDELFPAALAQKSQRKDSAFAVVVGPHHKQQILDRDHDRQRPEDQGKNAVDICRIGRDMLASESLAHRIQRTRPNIAIDNT